MSETDKKLPVIFCAADTADSDHALALAASMQRAGCGLKLGLEYFSAHGAPGVREIKKSYDMLPLFLDLKFHDIPNTVAGAVRAVADLEPAFINVHALGGSAMMRAARDALDDRCAQYGLKRPALLAVTILTSMDGAALDEIGLAGDAQDHVSALARLAKSSGMDGIVCSAHEIAAARAACGDDFILMVPGIRPPGSEAGDQKRVMSPQQARAAGANHLVIGRPITGAEDSFEAARAIMGGLSA